MRFIIFFLTLFVTMPTYAQSCDVSTRKCLIEELLTEAEQIDNDTWQAQIYREAAKSMAKHGNIDGAIALIPKIKNPDTLALTIRGIGMEAAGLNLSQDRYDAVFNKLKDESNKIEHPPSQAIAFTYIAMSQAFAGDDDGAWQTAASMENDALRNKAYGETAEIQAEMGKYDEAMKSIGFINQASFRNKAYTTVSKILADEGYYQNAFYAAKNIDNPYKKANAYQYILDAQDEAVIESDQGIAND
jgi:ATP/maltotriose-dependent transcriptional regulator MalT